MTPRASDGPGKMLRSPKGKAAQRSVAFAMALFLLLIPPTSAHAAPPRSLLEICTDEDGGAEVLRRLDGWMSTARISWRPTASCGGGASSYVGRFSTRNGAVVFELQRDGGQMLIQRIPWLHSTLRPLGEADEMGRLPHLSLLLESLLAEERLGFLEREMEEVETPPPEETVPKAAARRPPTRAPPLPQTPPPPDPVEDPPPEDPVQEGAPAEPEPFVAPPEPEPESEEVNSAQAEEAHEEPEGGEPAPEEPQEDFGVPLRKGWPWSARGELGARFRSPDFLGPEVGLGGTFGPLYLAVALQPPTEWILGGRPLLVGGVSIAGGWQIQTSLPVGEARFSGGLVAERVLVQRRDLAWAQLHAYWDAGPSMGAEILTPFLGTTVGVSLEGGWMPTTRSIVLPEGAAAPLGMAWGRLSLRMEIGK